jgi:hypothetical protein
MLRPVRGLAVFLCVVGCARAPVHRSVSPTALRGVVVAIAPVEDKRPSDSAGCGQLAPDLPQRTEKGLYVTLSDAGAEVSRRAPWMLAVTVLHGGAAAEYAGSQRGQLPINSGPQRGGEFPPVLAEPRGGMNGGWDETTVSLDAELSRDGHVVWHGTASGSERSAPCVQPREMLAGALSKAVDNLRDRVIREIARSP